MAETMVGEGTAFRPLVAELHGQLLAVERKVGSPGSAGNGRGMHSHSKLGNEEHSQEEQTEPAIWAVLLACRHAGACDRRVAHAQLEALPGHGGSME